MLLNSIINILLCFNGYVNSREIVVATYNLWNVMYHWEVRKLYISEMLQEIDADIIGFQEVRAHKDLEHSQLDELQSLLPVYKHKHYEPIHLIENEFSSPAGWEWEGIGYLSKHKANFVDRLNFTFLKNSPDQNQRLMLYSQFLVHPSDHEVNVAFVHLSYERLQQCLNVAEMLRYLYGSGVENTILLGDFNTYADFHWPVEALSAGRINEEAPSECKVMGKEFDQKQYRGYGYNFLDAWGLINPNHHGYTFSNMPVPGFINRPDRIMASTAGLKINGVLIRGKGARYARRYRDVLWRARLSAVYNAAVQRSSGKNWDRSCAWDCGPHGSCRCGICVAGGDENNCMLSDCTECSSSKLSTLYMIILLLIPCFSSILLSFTVLVLGIARPRIRRLCITKFKLGKLISKYSVVLSLFCIVCIFMFVRVNYNDVFNIVALQLEEELYPSDHLMVIAKINVL
ncbi:uncharacterized protein LOC130625495 [Hydractinia symbiolongicarpus]|uniref:uncharacterized protein LOC130625495 n=1 Tax=Hydractinia symbiolongicarpus TaxID=13093 RepID=UPI00254C5A69|nr:uncharacterized protein LOC130625495 [Hydractinia symbiolongicarpus]